MRGGAERERAAAAAQGEEVETRRHREYFYDGDIEGWMCHGGCDDLLIKSTLLLDFLKTIDIVRVIL
jgi:hypothetical protein